VTGRIEQVLKALNDAGVRYLIAGGVAVVLHGYLRTTADLDLVVQLDEGNTRRAMDALSGLGYRPRAPVQAAQFADPAVRQTWIDEKGMTVFSMWKSGDAALEVDLFVAEPFDFDHVYAEATEVQLDTTTARVVPLRTLIEMKRKTGRPQDEADAAALEALEDEAE
jgi:predicted nucleotidyltransferase